MQIIKSLIIGIITLVVASSANSLQIKSVSYIADLMVYLSAAYFLVENTKKEMIFFLLPNLLLSILVFFTNPFAFPAVAPAHFILASLGTSLGLFAKRRFLYSLITAAVVAIGISIATPHWVFYWSLEEIKKANLVDNFTLVDLNGRHHTNKDFLNKTVFLDFWSLSCGACIANFPNIEKLKEHYANNKNVEIYLVNLGKSDKFEKWEKFIYKHNFQHLPMLYDTLGILSKSLEIEAVPLHLIVKNGEIHWAHVGISADEKKIFTQKIINVIDDIATQ